MYRDGDLAMSLIRNGYLVSTRRGFLGVLFSALLTLALFDPGAATAQELKQVKLTEKHIQGFMAAYDDIARRVDEYHDDHVRHRPADQEVHRAARTNQGCDRGTQFRQIPTGGGKEGGRGATRSGAHDGKTHSIQGKHRAGAKVLRQAHTIHAGNG